MGSLNHKILKKSIISSSCTRRRSHEIRKMVQHRLVRKMPHRLVQHIEQVRRMLHMLGLLDRLVQGMQARLDRQVEGMLVQMDKLVPNILGSLGLHSTFVGNIDHQPLGKT